MKLQSINPHNQSVVGELDISTQEDISQAVQKAKKTFEEWRFTPIEERMSYVKKYRENIVTHKDELAKLITLEMGKPLVESIGEIDMELPYIEYYIEKGQSNLQDEVVYTENNTVYRTTYEPFGVCVCIAPWNFPLTLFDSGVLPSLIAGNTVVFKPSEYTSLSQKLCCDLLQQTGLPDGVLNLVIGASDVGRQLIDSPIDLVWFTGSTRAGQEIYAKCGQKFIKCLAEMGGSSAGIVFEDVDIANAVENIYSSRFFCAGQVCNAVKRLFVEKPLYEEFVLKLTEKINSISLGNPLENNDIGPLVNKKQLETLESQIQDAIQKGAKVVVGAKRPTKQGLQNGNYYEPTILTNVSYDMKVMIEEVFGPVLPVMPFETEDEVISMANNTIYGLANEVYTNDLEKGERVAKRLHSGVVTMNTFDYFKAPCPFGGYKKSGIGREYGKIGMQEFAQVKLIAKLTP